MTKKREVEVLHVGLAARVKRGDAIRAFPKQETPMVRIRTDDGLEGVGYTYTIGTGGSSVMALLRDHLAPQLLGRDPEMVGAAVPNAPWVEHIPQLDVITKNGLKIEKGYALPYTDPGLGMEWDWKAIAKLAVAGPERIR